ITFGKVLKIRKACNGYLLDKARSRAGFGICHVRTCADHSALIALRDGTRAEGPRGSRMARGWGVGQATPPLLIIDPLKIYLTKKFRRRNCRRRGGGCGSKSCPLRFHRAFRVLVNGQEMTGCGLE